MHSRCTDLVRIVPTFEFLRQALVKSKGASFRASIIYILGVDHETCHAGDSNNVSVISLDHGGAEFLDEQKMSNNVHVKNPTHLGLRLVQDILVGADSGIIDQDCGFAMLGTDSLSDFMDLVGGCDIGLIEMDSGN